MVAVGFFFSMNAKLKIIVYYSFNASRALPNKLEVQFCFCFMLKTQPKGSDIVSVAFVQTVGKLYRCWMEKNMICLAC